MHDGGGDRSNTVRALPRIIQGARDRGFRFVALEEVRGGPSPIALNFPAVGQRVTIQMENTRFPTNKSVFLATWSAETM